MATETENTPAKYEHEDFLIFDEADEKQIAEADQNLKNALVYELKGKTELSYIGLKHMVLLMSRKGEALKVIDKSLELIGDVWYASITTENSKTGYQTVGISQQHIMMKSGAELVPDEFARTKAFSKAERNSWRKHIPELQIKSFMDAILNKNPDTKQELANEGYCGCSYDKMELTADEGGCRTCQKKVSDAKKEDYKRRKTGD